VTRRMRVAQPKDVVFACRHTSCAPTHAYPCRWGTQRCRFGHSASSLQSPLAWPLTSLQWAHFGTALPPACPPSSLQWAHFGTALPPIPVTCTFRVRADGPSGAESTSVIPAQPSVIPADSGAATATTTVTEQPTEPATTTTTTTEESTEPTDPADDGGAATATTTVTEQPTEPATTTTTTTITEESTEPTDPADDGETGDGEEASLCVKLFRAKDGKWAAVRAPDADALYWRQFYADKADAHGALQCIREHGFCLIPDYFTLPETNDDIDADWVKSVGEEEIFEKMHVAANGFKTDTG